MDEEERQKPLSLRFEAKRFWPELRRELGLDRTGAAVVLDICKADGWVSYSRTARHYDVPARYRNPLYTWRTVVGAVDKLDSLGLIHHDKRPPGVRGWQSAVAATEGLKALNARIIGDEILAPVRLPEVIMLRDASRRLLDYRDTRPLDRMRRRCEGYNEAILSAGLDPTITAPLARIFHGDMTRGGRFYAMGASWQNVKADARRTLTIGGEAVAELDFRNLHPALLYAEAGATMPSDCYELPGWPRKLVKLAVLTLINAPTIGKARLAIAHSDPMGALAETGSQAALAKADRLIADIKRMHRPIAHAFHSDAGAWLMQIDANIADCVMNTLMLQGIVVLPVHDSFLVQASQRDKLEAAMLDAAYQVGQYVLQVDEK